jgi:hypothetical protein
MPSVACDLCQQQIPDIYAHGVHQYVSGWVKQRGEGGGHGVSVPKRYPRFAHHHCVEAAARGMLGQASLFTR